MSQINAQRLAKNSIMLYIRVFITLIISLWTTRLVLRALGVNDYGIYNVVAGFVSLFNILSGSLASAISRYITFEIGRENRQNIQNIFVASLKVQLTIALIILILAETIGLWFVNNSLNIDPEYSTALNWVYQCSIATLILGLINVPYNALIIGYEKMNVFAYSGIFMSVGLLCGGFILYILPSHRLIFYSVFNLTITLLLRIFYGIYCRKKLGYTFSSTGAPKNLLKELFSFAGWNFIGSAAGMLKDQGLNILLNIFFGTAVNAARGIALQINTAVVTFYGNFLTALNPQIIKSYSAKEYAGSIKLTQAGSRFGYLMSFVISLPILLETPFILNLWLGEIPKYTVSFTYIILCTTLVDSLSNSLITLTLATGKIAKYQIVVGGINLLVVPFAYLMLKLGYSPQTALIVSMIMSVAALCARVIMLHELIDFSIIHYLNDVILRILFVSVISLTLSYGIKYLFPAQTWGNVLIVIFTTLAISITSIFFLGLGSDERNYIKGILYKKLHIRLS